MKLLSCDREHELYAVFLINLRRAGVIVDCNYVGVRLNLFDFSDCALAVDVVWQTAERLSADNILIARFGKLEHFGGEQPALAHFAAVADYTLYKLLGVSVLVGRHKVESFGSLNHERFKLCYIVEQTLTEFIFNAAAAEHFIVLDSVIDLK